MLGNDSCYTHWLGVMIYTSEVYRDGHVDIGNQKPCVGNGGAFEGHPPYKRLMLRLQMETRRAQTTVLQVEPHQLSA